MKPYALPLLLLPLSACASIIEGSTQQINLQTNPPLQANCRLSNERGVWQSTAPAMVMVKRSKSDLNVECQSSDVSGHASNSSDAESWTFANVLLGGIIGAGVDAGTGAMFAYDDAITVPLSGSDLPLSSNYPSGFYEGGSYPHSTQPAAHSVRSLQSRANDPVAPSQTYTAAAAPQPAFTLPQVAPRPFQRATTPTTNPYERVDNAFTVAAPDVADYTADDSRLSDLAPAAAQASYYSSAQSQQQAQVRPLLLPLPIVR